MQFILNRNSSEKRRKMSSSAKITLAILLVSCGIVWGQDIPTLIPPSSFNPESDASTLDDAMSGLGTDEDQLISVLCYRSFDQRAQVTISYNNRYGNLVNDLQSELSADFKILMVSLTYGKSTYLSLQLNEVMAGPGTDEPSLTEILISRTNQELEEVRNTYAAYFGTPLVNALEAELTGSLLALMTRIAEGSRDESTVVDLDLVAQDVQALYNAGEANLEGTDEGVFIDIFATRNWLHIREMSNQYDALYGSLESTIVSEFIGDMENSLVSIVRYSRDKAAYFAARFFLSINGAGTADRDLRRLTVSRCETDLGNIKIAYQNIYSVSLSNAVSDDTSGDYRTALLALIG